MAAAEVEEDTEYLGLYEFCTKARALDFERPITDFVVGLVTDHKRVTSGVACTLDKLSALFPSQVMKLIDSSKAEKAMFLTADEINKGQSVGVLQCSLILRKANHEHVAIGAKPEFVKATVIMKKEFGIKLYGTMTKCEFSRVLAFKKKYDNIVPAVGALDFETVPWLTSKARDEAMEVEMKAMEAFFLGYSTTLHVVEDLFAMMDSMHWATDTQKKAISDPKNKLNQSDQLQKELATTMACMILTNGVLTHSPLDASKTYATTKLKVPLASLPSTLRDKMVAQGPGTKSSSSQEAVTPSPKRLVDTPESSTQSTDASIEDDKPTNEF